MNAVVVDLGEERHLRAYYTAIGYNPKTPARPENAAFTLEAAQRAFLAVEDALNPWPDSILIAMLAGATPREREEIVRELEARARR